MAGEPQGRCYFAGIEQVVSATINVVHGITPSVCVITMAPQFGDIAPMETLHFLFGGVHLSWRDAKIDYGSLRRDGRGRTWQLTVLDRRWKWQERNGGNQISGLYNVWRDNFTLQDSHTDPEQANTQTNTRDTEKTPQELCELCLKAMGEENYDVADVPNESRPPVEWDYDNPAEALAELCDLLGCRVVLQLDDKVAIRKVGEGRDLPEDGAMDTNITIDVPEIPDKIAIVTGLVRSQVDFQLEAVGLDAPYDNQPPEIYELSPSGDLLKPLNKLSYARNPNDDDNAGGFTYADVDGGFFNVGTGPNGEDVTGMRERAQRSVFRYYRIKFPVKIPGYEENNGLIYSMDQLLLESECVNQWWQGSVLENMPAQCFGVWCPMSGDLNNTTDKLEPAKGFPTKRLDTGKKPIFYERGFQIDTARGLVIFNEPVFLNALAEIIVPGQPPAALIVAPAKMVLRTACSIRDRDTGKLGRFEFTQNTGFNFGSGTRYVKHEEIVLTFIPQYDVASYSQEITSVGDPRTIQNVTTNRYGDDGVEKQCQFYLDQIVQEYQTTFPIQMTYAGLRGDIELDGAIQHLSFTVGPQGAMTSAARNSEIQKAVLTYRERRRNEKVKKMAKAQSEKAGNKTLNKVDAKPNKAIASIA